jgi:hypothetical protein
MTMRPITSRCGERDREYRPPARRLATARRGGRIAALAAAVLVLAGAAVAACPATAATGADAERTWGLGWDDGLTVRRWLGPWELGVAAGPDDDLIQLESTEWHQADPPAYQGLVEVPQDERRESGWVRGQAGFRLRHDGPLTLVVYSGLAYGWIDHQSKTALLDPVSGGYDTVETNRFTHRWAWDLGLRPAWRPVRWLTVEFSFGLRYAWERWDETTVTQPAGVPDPDRRERDGETSSFRDFGWEGLGSLAFLFWL